LLVVIGIVAIIAATDPDKPPARTSPHITSKEKPRPKKKVTLPAPKPKLEPKPLEPEPPKRSALEVRYAAFAAAYREAVANGTVPPVLPPGPNSGVIGTLPGAFQIMQILDPHTAVFNKIDSDGFPSWSVRVENVDTTGHVDEQNVTFGDRIFAFKGTWSYYTILLARRTIYRVEALNKTMLANAVAELEDEEEAAREAARQRHRECVRAAQEIVDKLKAASNTFEAENWRTAKYLHLTERVRMYGKHTTNPRMEQVWQKAKDELKDLGSVSQADIDAYRAKKKEYLQPLQKAQANLAAVITEAPE